jgi:hypothetical protein
VVLFYSVNLFHIPELTPDFSSGAVKYFFNRIPWLFAYILMLSILRGLFVEMFIKGFICGTLFNAGLTILEAITFLTSGRGIEYRFLGSIFIQTQAEKALVNQDLLRPTGVTIDPNYAASYAFLAILLLDFLQSKCSNKRRTILYGLLKIIIFVPAFMLQSRTAIFSFLITFFLSVFLRMFNNKRMVVVPKLALVVLITLLAAGAYLKTAMPDYYATAYKRILLADQSSGTRMLYLDEYFSRTLNPNSFPYQGLLGHGTGSSGYFLGNVGYGVEKRWSPESNYLTILIEQGGIFLCFYTLSLAYLFFRLLKYDHRLALCAFYLCTIGLTYNFLGDRVYWIFLVTFMCIPMVLQSPLVASAGKTLFSQNRFREHSEKVYPNGA